MDNLVKQRLVGALILLALAVVFWPIIFVPTAERGSDFSVEVPEPPPVDMAPLPEPDNLALRRGAPAQAQLEDEAADVLIPSDSPLLAAAEASGAKENMDASRVNAPPPLPAKTQTLTQEDIDKAGEALKAPEIDDDGLPIAFSLQVATLGDRAGANKLRDALVDAGYKGYIKRLRRDGKDLYRVLVGPKYSRDELLPIKATVDQTWRVESMIIRYLP